MSLIALASVASIAMLLVPLCFGALRWSRHHDRVSVLVLGVCLVGIVAHVTVLSGAPALVAPVIRLFGATLFAFAALELLARD